ncbi:hypothetical protein GTPT_1889 [Tatumella ptyseos ATCC 33301]|uniref:Uncharacterized protein n=1 Tax=Tatumella ptyseos ATCC 33301 TaxID=1005995 RepID=A0A085JF59_9GAMM|nr:hypothetical protein GTPT_1889 [Tatumella ptyseos ATCC 33301]
MIILDQIDGLSATDETRIAISYATFDPLPQAKITSKMN